MQQAGLLEGDDIFVLGFPMGIMSRGNQRAICRSGCVARIRDFYDDQNQPYLIDAQVFPGSSGGLVVTSPDALSIAGSKAITSATAIGIVTHVHAHWARGRLEDKDGTRFRIEDPAGIGVVQPMDRVVEAIAHYRATHSGQRPATEDETVRSPDPAA